MKSIFIGTVEFSYYALKKLIEMKTKISGVITKSTSPFNADFVDLRPLSQKANIPYRFTTNINSPEDVAWIQSMKPDIIFCFGWSSLIKNEILEIPPLGVIGFHPAALPKNRGRHPIVWAIVLGLTKTASTFFFMDEGTDSGDILSQEAIEITYEDNARALYDKITKTALKQIELFLPQLENGKFTRTHQDHSKANTWRKRNKNDSRIDFRMSSRTVYNLVRSLTKPYIGAHIDYKGKEIKVWRVEEIEINLPNIEPGKVLHREGNRLVVNCAEKAVAIVEHEFQNLPDIGDYL